MGQYTKKPLIQAQLQSLAEDLQLAGQMDGKLCSSGEGGTGSNDLPVCICMCGSAHDCGCVVDGSNAFTAITIMSLEVYVAWLLSYSKTWPIFIQLSLHLSTITLSRIPSCSLKDALHMIIMRFKYNP